MTRWGGQEQFTVVDALRRRLDADPDGPYLDLEGRHYTAAEMEAETNRLANALAAMGVGPGDRVGALLENGPEAVVFWLAAVKTGAVAVPVNTAYKGTFLAHQLHDCGAEVVVVQGDFASRIADVAADLPALEHVIVAGDADVEKIGSLNRHSWDEALSAPADAVVADVAPQQLATLIYTAGTTGPSKGCMLSHNYVVSLGTQIARTWGRRPDDVVWTPLPLFHFNAISVGVVGTLLLGGRASIARRFSVSGFWPEIRRTGATMTSMLGSLAILLSSAPDHPDQQSPQEGGPLRLVAGAPMPPSVDQAWRERFGVATFSAGYGITEASLLSALPPGETNKAGAAGKRNDVEFDVHLVDDRDEPVPVGEVGEIVCRPRAPHVMFDGYWGRADATVAVSSNWWFHTGDLGRLDEDDFLYFVDRKKDYLRRRGENISSFEMEKTFMAHPAIAEVAVHSVPSDVGEDDVKVTAVVQAGAALTEEELCRWSVDKVPYFAVPRYIEFRPELPKNPVQRVLKYELRDEGVTATTWDREAAGFTFDRR